MQSSHGAVAAFGIFKDSYKIITSRNPNLNRTIIPLFLPVYTISLINQLVFQQLLLSPKSPAFSFSSFQSAPFWLLQLACLITSLATRPIFSSSGIYAAACIHTGQELSFNDAMAVSSKVSKRLFSTFFSTFTAVATLSVFFMTTMMMMMMSLSSRGTGVLVIAIAAVVFFAYAAGMVYLMTVSLLANAVSVLEEVGGFEAMKKSNQLLKGNVCVATIMFLSLAFAYLVLEYAFAKLVVYAWSLGMVAEAFFEVIPLVLFLMVLTLIEIVSQTVLYCFCKSHHHENVVDRLHQLTVLKTEEPQLEKLNHG